MVCQQLDVGGREHTLWVAMASVLLCDFVGWRLCGFRLRGSNQVGSVARRSCADFPVESAKEKVQCFQIPSANVYSSVQLREPA